jgi:hypothetical protein
MLSRSFVACSTHVEPSAVPPEVRMNASRIGQPTSNVKHQQLAISLFSLTHAFRQYLSLKQRLPWPSTLVV